MTKKSVKSDPSTNGATSDPTDFSFDHNATEDTAGGHTEVVAKASRLSQPPVDPYDPNHLGLSQDFMNLAAVKKQWDIIKVEKPSKSRVFRVHPTLRIKTMLLALKEDNEIYMIAPEVRGVLRNEGTCGIFTLRACVTKQGTPFLWPIRMADPDGKWNIWHQSAWQIAEKAQVQWARMQANRDAGHYVAEYDQRPPDEQQEPDWPDLEFRDWLRLAFQGFTIDSLDHPVVKRLRLED